MAKQKFYCKGVEQASGRRVAVTLSADNKESAVRIAKEHGVLVESVVPAQEPRPAAGRPPAAAGVDEDVSGLLDWPDDEAEGLDLAAAAKPEQVSPSPTKFCPYCGGQIPAAAVKCKHCHEVLTPSAQMEQALIRTKDFVGASVITLLLYFLFWLPGVITNLIYLQDANRIKKATGREPAGRGILLWLFWLCGVAPVALGFLFISFIILGILLTVWGAAPAPPALPTPVASSPTPPALPALPKPEKPKPTAEEKAFAAKLAAFLDGYDATTRLLETAPKPDDYRKQHEALKTLFAAVPAPPKGVAWAEEAAASSKRLLDLADMLNSSLTTLDAAMRAIGQSPGNSPESREACRQAAGQMRDLVATVRGLIPPACLTP